MIIGITGGTGCGKTTALNTIRQLGGVVIDCDAVYHELLKTDTRMLAAIEDRFPGSVIQGILDRKKLGALVFSDPDALADLNKITHQAVKNQVLEQLRSQPALAAIDAIGLFESGLNELCDITVAVTAPRNVRIARLIARDHIDELYAAKRIAAQKPQSYFQEKCDYVLENVGTQQEFQHKCLAFFGNPDIIKKEIQ